MWVWMGNDVDVYQSVDVDVCGKGCGCRSRCG